MPQTLSHGALSFYWLLPGEAHLSDALGAGMVACPPAPVAASGAVDGHGSHTASLRRCHSIYSIWQNGFTLNWPQNWIRPRKSVRPISLRPELFGSVSPSDGAGLLLSVNYRRL